MYPYLALAFLATAGLAVCRTVKSGDTQAAESINIQSDLRAETQSQIGPDLSLWPSTLKNPNDRPYESRHPVFMHKLLRSEQFRRLAGDLETCGSDLSPYLAENDVIESVEVKASSIRSCREAIFTFIRWVKGDNEFLNLLSTSTKTTHRRSILDILEHPGVPMSSRVHLNVPRAESDAEEFEDPVLRDCEAKVCRIGHLQKICSKPQSLITNAESAVCQLCFPRNKELLLSHCAAQYRREKRTFYLLLVMLVSGIALAAFRIVFNDCISKARQIPKNQRTKPIQSPFKFRDIVTSRVVGLFTRRHKREESLPNLPSHDFIAMDVKHTGVYDSFGGKELSDTEGTLINTVDAFSAQNMAADEPMMPPQAWIPNIRQQADWPLTRTAMVTDVTDQCSSSTARDTS